MNVFKHHSSSNTKKRKTTRSNNKQQHTSNSTTADTSNHHSPQQNSTPHHLEAGHRHRDHLERVKFTWVRSEGLEYGMFCGQSAQWDNTVYFRTGGSNEIFEYSCRGNSWIRLVPPPFRGATLVVIDGLVTAVGGYDSWHRDMDKLVCLVDGKWEELHHPPMPTSRHYAMAMVVVATTSSSSLVVAGGSVGNNVRVSAVEVLDVAEQYWTRVADLPTPTSSASCCVHGETLYLVGGFNAQGEATTRTLTCTLGDLVGGVAEGYSATPTSSRPTSTSNHATPTTGCWREVADAPSTFASCAIVNGNLIVVGGLKKPSKRPTGDIHRYDPSTNMWEGIGCMPTPRYCTCVASLPHGELMVVGGINGQLGADSTTNLLEVATF